MRQLGSAILVLATAFAVVPVRAQRSLGVQSAPTTSIDFLAIDEMGRPISDLGAADITVRIDGRARDVRRFEYVTFGGAATSDPLPAPFASNVRAGAATRSIALVIDSDTMPTGREGRTRTAILQMLETLGPRDQVTLVTIPHGGASVALTSNLALVRDAVGRIVGAAPQTETVEDASLRSSRVLQALTDFLDANAGRPDPLEVVFLSSGMSGQSAAAMIGSRNSRGAVSSQGVDLMSNEVFQRFGQAIAAARAHFYVVQPEEGAAPTVTGSSTGIDSQKIGLENLAGSSGGSVLPLTGANENSLVRIARETSGHYVVTVSIDPQDANGNRHVVSVKSARPGVELRVRPHVVIDKPLAGSAAAKDLLRTARVYTELPIGLTSLTSRNAGDGKLKIIAVASLLDTGAKLANAAVGIFDTNGKLLGQSTATAEMLTSGAVTAAFVQPAGGYRVRVAAIDTGGRAGTTDETMTAALQPVAGALSLSALALGTPEGGFTPRLEFREQAQGVAYFELYGGKTGMPVSVNVDIATTINGPALAELQPKISATGEPDRFIVTTPISLASLAPGDYVVRAIVGLDGQPATRIVRTLRKSK